MLQIELSGAIEQQVNALIASGRFDSAHEVVLAALDALEKLQADRVAERDRITAEVEAGIADVRAGNVGPLDMDATREEAQRELEQAQRRAG